MDIDIFNNIFFTVAIMFTRQGIHFRGNEYFDEKFGINISKEYLREQTAIVKPKIIMPLGNSAWGMIREICELHQYDNRISEVVNDSGKSNIKKYKTIIIPNYHPLSHASPDIQYDI